MFLTAIILVLFLTHINTAMFFSFHAREIHWAILVFVLLLGKLVNLHLISVNETKQLQLGILIKKNKLEKTFVSIIIRSLLFDLVLMLNYGLEMGLIVLGFLV